MALSGSNTPTVSFHFTRPAELTPPAELETGFMAMYSLAVSAALTNIVRIEPSGGIDHPNTCYCFKVRCTKCREVSNTVVCVQLNLITLGPDGVPYHKMRTCKICRAIGMIAMIQGQGTPLTLEMSQAGTAATIMWFYCNTLEPMDFSFTFSDDWTAHFADGDSMEFELAGGDLFGQSIEEDDNGLEYAIVGLRAEFIQQ